MPNTIEELEAALAGLSLEEAISLICHIMKASTHSLESGWSWRWMQSSRTVTTLVNRCGVHLGELSKPQRNATIQEWMAQYPPSHFATTV